MPVCSSCALEVSETARFCPGCGAAIVSIQKPAAPVAPQTTSAAAASLPAKHPTVSDIASRLPDNIAGMLAYFVLPAIVFLLIRPFNRNRFVRFHSLQCLLTVAVLIVLQFAVVTLGRAIPLFVLSLYGLLLLAELTLWLLLLFKAYQHEEFKLPAVGDIAEMWANRL